MFLLPLYYAIYAGVIASFALLAVSGIALGLWGVTRRSYVMILSGGTLALLGAACLVMGLFGDRLESVEGRASRIMVLPAGAKILGSQYGDWGGGYVEFSLPPTQDPEAWLETVWRLNQNAIPQSAILSKTSSTRTTERRATFGEDSISLKYDIETNLFYYHFLCSV